MGGWIKLHRKLQFSDMFQSLTAKQRDVMIQLIFLANHEPHKWEWKGSIYKVKRGQCITSLESIKKLCANDVSLKNIRTALVKLEKWQFLANESTKTGRLITVLNYDRYQDKEEPTGKDNGKQAAKDGQTGGKQAATNKNDKEGLKKDKEKDIEISEIELNEIIKDWLNQFSWIEQIEKNYKDVKNHIARNPNFVKDQLKEFLKDQSIKGDMERSRKELKSHFVSYIKKYAKETPIPLKINNWND